MTNMPSKPDSGHRRSALLMTCAILISFLLGTLMPVRLSDYVNLVTAVAEKQKAKTANSTSKAPTPLDSSPPSSTGWHQVDVFYGNSSLLARKVKGRTWNSQCQQDKIVYNLLGKGGYFVELAANDATYISNTYSLEAHHGWNGLCIEGNPMYWHGLASRPRCHVIGAVVGHETMEEISFRFRGALGGIVGPKFDNKGGKNTVDETRFTVTLSDIFARYQVPATIDYLSLDVEGAETYIMSDFPFKDYMMKVMTVERPGDKLKQLFKENGYVFIAKLSGFGETLWCHGSLKSTLNFTAAGLTVK